MLKALYDFGVQHPESRLSTGFEPRSLDFILDFSSSGQFLGIRSSETKKVMAPTRGKITRQPIANIIIEKAKVAVFTDNDSAQVAFKQFDFWNILMQENRASVPAFDVLLKARNNATLWSTVEQKLFEAGCQPENTVTFAVDGIDLHDNPAVITWWQNKVCDDVCPDIRLDFITGEPCHPVRLWRSIPVEAAGGGKSTGISLVSFNELAFCSYGASQGQNAPVAPNTAATIIDALRYLGERGTNIGSTRVIYWFSQDKTAQTNILDIPDGLKELFAGISPLPDPNKKLTAKQQTANAKKLYQSVFTGTVPPDLTGIEYHIALMQPNSARMSVKNYTVGDYAILYQNLKDWFDDMRIAKLNGHGKTYNRGLDYLVESLTPNPDAKNKDDRIAPIRPLYQAMLLASLYNRPIPEQAAHLALSRIRSLAYHNFTDKNDNPTLPERQCQILKLWLNRHPNTVQEEKIMEELNPNLSQTGYQCGRMLAVYEKLQVAATRRTDLASKFYAGCSTRPAFMLNKLQKLGTYWLNKLDDNNRAKFSEQLSDIACQLQDIPDKLDTRSQAYFALGYWQQIAAMH